MTDVELNKGGVFLVHRRRWLLSGRRCPAAFALLTMRRPSAATAAQGLTVAVPDSTEVCVVQPLRAVHRESADGGFGAPEGVHTAVFAEHSRTAMRQQPRPARERCGVLSFC